MFIAQLFFSFNLFCIFPVTSPVSSSTHLKTMAPEPIKTDPTLTDGEKQKLLDREIREMISALTRRLSGLQNVQKQTGSSHNSHDQGDDNDDENGVRIITLAGSNTGAAMRGELDDKSSPHGHGGGPHPRLLSENEALDTYVNSNFQAINNSIMMGGSYSSNDPGVHMDISDYLEQHQGHTKHAGKVEEKKRETETYRSDQHSEPSD
ncbi:unnamed protein product [Camellia sinensis]